MRSREEVLREFDAPSSSLHTQKMADRIRELEAVQDAREAVVRDAVAFVGALEAYHAMVNGNEGAYLNNLGESEDQLKQSVRHLATLTETEVARDATPTEARDDA
jgi:hypothetical protein